MPMETNDDLTVRYSRTFRAAILLLVVPALVVCIPRAIHAVPAEAFGALAFFLFVPALPALGFLYASAYRLRIRADGITVETLFLPIIPFRRLRYEEVSRMEAGANGLHLILYRYGVSRPFRIMNMDLLEGGPPAVLAALSRHIPAEKNFLRNLDKVSCHWRGYILLENTALLLGTGLISLNVLKIGGMLGFMKVDWSIVNISLLIAVLLLLSAAGWILRRMNCED